ncbi:MAG: hypothetical protein NC900_05515, partial [Candidatus Omnitrophica bacterium]|nr:hypothetical protein [Candidatus Omnitrophota bacterium]
IVVAVFVGMQIYIKRGIQGVIKLSADDLGKQEKETEHPLKGKLEYSLRKSNTISQEIINLKGRIQGSKIDKTIDQTGSESLSQQIFIPKSKE